MRSDWLTQSTPGAWGKHVLAMYSVLCSSAFYTSALCTQPTRHRMPANTHKHAATLAQARTLANTPWCDDYEKMISGVLYVPCCCCLLACLPASDQRAPR